jgi:hypothetical protein
VMLASVPANVDLATQEILEMAKDVDPEGLRTAGVLTKPDLVDRGAEQNIIDLIEGKGRDAQLDWSVVRNPGQLDLDDPAADRTVIEEKFFDQVAPWNSVSPDRRGINALRERLVELLTEHVYREFPKVSGSVLATFHLLT